MLPLVKGARVVYLETLNTTELLRALNERQISIFAVVPQFFYLIHERIFKEVAKRGQVAGWALKALMTLNRGLRAVGFNAGRIFFGKLHSTFGDRMRYLITGGSRFDPQIGYDFYALGIDVLQAYGLTETTGAAFAALAPSQRHRFRRAAVCPAWKARLSIRNPAKMAAPPSAKLPSAARS